MFVSEVDNLSAWEMSDEEWEAQLADLIRRDSANHDEIDDALLDAARLADDDPWTEWPSVCPLDDASADPAALSDTAIIDTIPALQHHLDWAGARQARLLASSPPAAPPPPLPTPREQPGSAGGHLMRSPSPCPCRG